MKSSTAIQQNPPPPSRQRRLSLASVTTARRLPPLRVLIYGPGGIGKTTFACDAKDAIVISAEDGADFKKVARFPAAESYQDVLDAVDVLREEQHSHRMVVLDSVDWIEQLISTHVCAKHKKDSLEAFGYGSGFALVFDEMRGLITQLERLRRDKGMGVVAIAHSTVRTFNNPEGENFDRYELKLQNSKNASVVGLWKEWPDFQLFANYEVIVSQSKKSGAKGESTGERFAYTQRTAAFDAKSRLALPDRLPLEWGAFARAVKDAFDSEGKEIESNG
jgi:hypothetical protein